MTDAVFCGDCGRVLNRATGRCVCMDDAQRRVPVMAGASARTAQSGGGTPLIPLRGEPLVTTFDAVALPLRSADAPATRAVRTPRFVIPRATIEGEDRLVDVLVYDDAMVLSHAGLDNEVSAPDVTSVGGRLRRAQQRKENERRLARVAHLPAEQALMTDRRNELFAPRSPDHAELRPTHGGGELVLHLRHHGERRLSWATQWAAVEEVEEALRPLFGELLIRRPPTLGTVGSVALDLVMSIVVVALAGYLGWSYLLA